MVPFPRSPSPFPAPFRSPPLWRPVRACRIGLGERGTGRSCGIECELWIVRWSGRCRAGNAWPCGHVLDLAGDDAASEVAGGAGAAGLDKHGGM